MRYYYIIILLITFTSSLSADEVWTTYPLKIQALAVADDYILLAQGNHVFKWNEQEGLIAQYTNKNGKTDQWIGGMIIGENGSVWIASDNGIFCLDDGKWTEYTTDDGLVYNVVNKLYIDNNGVLWAGTPYGLSSFDGSLWRTYTTENGLAHNDIFDITEDKNNNKWFGTKGGLSRLDGSSWTNYTTENGLEENEVRGLLIDQDNIVWVATCAYRGEVEGGGHTIYSYNYLQSFDGKEWKTHKSKKLLEGATPFVPLFVDDDNILWYEDDDSICTLDVKYYRFGSGYRNSIAHAGLDSDGIIWMVWGNYYRDFVSFDGAEFTNYIIGPENPQITTITEDSDNVKWFGSEEGLSRFDGKKWTTYYEVGTDFTIGKVNASVYDKNGILWLATENGVVTFDGTDWNHIENDMLIPEVRKIAVDDDNVIWFCFGTQGGGVVSLSGTDWEIFTREDGLIHNKVYEIAVDRNNVKWFGTRYGLSSFDGTHWDSFTTSNSGLPMNIIMAIAVDQNNVKWFGTSSYGITGFDGSAWITYTTSNGLVSNYVRTIAVGTDNKKWIGTKEGVSMFDGTIWKTYTTQEGLIINDVKIIAVDRKNGVWFGTDNGITSFVDDENIPESVEESDVALKEFRIRQNYPNPFNASTTISFTIPSSGFTTLVIYNIMGQEVRELVSETIMPGTYSVTWDGKSDIGNPVSSGVYISRLKIDGYITTGRMLLMK